MFLMGTYTEGGSGLPKGGGGPTGLASGDGDLSLCLGPGIATLAWG